MADIDDLHVRIESKDVDGADAVVRSLSGRERIGAPFELWIDVGSDRDLDDDLVPGSPLSVVFERRGDVVRRVHGIVGEAEDALEHERFKNAYRVHLVPRIGWLGLVQRQAILLDRTTPQAIADKLALADLAVGTDFELRLAGTYPERDFITQYAETDLAFVSRLAEHLGIGFFFEHDDDRDRVVFADHAAGYASLGDAVPFRGGGSGGRSGDVFELRGRRRLVPEHHFVTDFNYRKPQLDLTATSRNEGRGALGGVVEYGSHAKDPKEAADLAAIRAGESRSKQRVLEGRSSVASFSAGHHVRVEGHGRLGTLDLLLVEVDHEAVFDHVERVQRGYTNRFVAVPSDVDYRPPRATPRPRIAGVVNGIVEGDGNAAKIDADGRYFVRFAFDIEGKDGRPSSRPIRMSQPHAGPGYGQHFPLKPGTEVLLAFVDGDPDRPIIVGSVPNALNPSPVNAANHRINKLKTASGCVLEFFDADG